ncbi:hypothetical protein LDENG_00178660 [Lucifuga dentata]|nr:hypothetical protein LDENG_00178660 [Lucifuga dentata]
MKITAVQYCILDVLWAQLQSDVCLMNWRPSQSSSCLSLDLPSYSAGCPSPDTAVGIPGKQWNCCGKRSGGAAVTQGSSALCLLFGFDYWTDWSPGYPPESHESGGALSAGLVQFQAAVPPSLTFAGTF